MRRTFVVSAAFAAFLTTSVAFAQPPALEQLRRIGCAACAGPELFATIMDLEIGHDSAVYVIDSSDPFMRVFDWSGAVRGTFGRRGNGPGEFSTPFSVALLNDTTLQIVDLRNRRLAVVTASGQELRSRPTTGMPLAVAYERLSRSFVVATDFIAPTLSVDVWPGMGEPKTLLRFGTDFPQGAGGAPSLLAALASNNRGEFAVADGAENYRIRVYDTTGKVVREISRSVLRKRRSPAEMREAEARRQRSISRGEVLGRVEAGGRGGVPRAAQPVAEEKPHFGITALEYDDRGRLWVRTERGDENSTIFDVFDAGGRFVGEARVPMRMSHYVIRQGLLAAVTFDADDAQYITLFRVRG